MYVYSWLPGSRHRQSDKSDSTVSACFVFFFCVSGRAAQSYRQWLQMERSALISKLFQNCSNARAARAVLAAAQAGSACKCLE